MDSALGTNLHRTDILYIYICYNQFSKTICLDIQHFKVQSSFFKNPHTLLKSLINLFRGTHTKSHT